MTHVEPLARMLAIGAMVAIGMSVTVLIIGFIMAADPFTGGSRARAGDLPLLATHMCE